MQDRDVFRLSFANTHGLRKPRSLLFQSVQGFFNGLRSLLGTFLCRISFFILSLTQLFFEHGDLFIKSCLALLVARIWQHSFHPSRNMIGMGHGLSAFENTGQSVIIFLSDGIELVVMAPGASDAEPHERAGHDINLFVDHIKEEFLLVLLCQHFWPDGQHPQRSEAFGLSGQIIRLWEQISGNLFFQEHIIGLVAVEGLNHIISVAPCVRESHVFVCPIGVSITHQIQPMSPPPLSITR